MAWALAKATAALAADDDAGGDAMAALTELCEALSFCTEDAGGTSPILQSMTPSRRCFWQLVQRRRPQIPSRRFLNPLPRLLLYLPPTPRHGNPSQPAAAYMSNGGPPRMHNFKIKAFKHWVGLDCKYAERTWKVLEIWGTPSTRIYTGSSPYAIP